MYQIDHEQEHPPPFQSLSYASDVHPFLHMAMCPHSRTSQQPRRLQEPWVTGPDTIGYVSQAWLKV
jgi:hypothetical protein